MPCRFIPTAAQVEEPFALSQPGSKAGENKFVRDGATGGRLGEWEERAYLPRVIGSIPLGTFAAVCWSGLPWLA